MIERANRFMPTANPSPGRFTPDTNGSATPRTPLSVRRMNMQDGHEGESDADRRQRELYSSQQNLLREQRTADQDKLLKAIGGKVQAWTGMHLLPVRPLERQLDGAGARRRSCAEMIETGHFPASLGRSPDVQEQFVHCLCSSVDQIVRCHSLAHPPTAYASPW